MGKDRNELLADNDATERRYRRLMRLMWLTLVALVMALVGAGILIWHGVI